MATTSHDLTDNWQQVAGLMFNGGSRIEMRVIDVSDLDTNLTGDFHFDEVDA